MAKDPFTEFQISMLCKPSKLCNICNRMTKAHVEELNMCAQCADDQIQRETGCRFGEANCGHVDCLIPPGMKIK